MSIILSLSIQYLPPVYSAANASAFEYGILGDSAILYSDSGMTMPKTTLPSTYFVIIIGDGGGDCYRVSYLDIDGYIAKSVVEPVDYEPKYKYASKGFSVANDGQGANIRSSPDHTRNNILTTLSSGSGGIYYGTVKGTSLIPEVGDLWYYVRYSTEPYLYGYIYKSQISVEPIEANIIERLEPEQNNETPSDTISYIIVAALTVPALIIMLFVFKKPSGTPRDRSKNK